MSPRSGLATGFAPRFRGTTASPRNQHLVSAALVVLLAGVGVAGVALDLAWLAFFAVGAGAGYSLSGSV